FQITVDDIASGVLRYEAHDVGYDRRINQIIVRVKEVNKVACGKRYGLVHGLVNPVIRLADVPGNVGGILRDDRVGAIFGCSVHQDVFDIMIRLRGDAADSPFNEVFSIFADGDDGKPHVLLSLAQDSRGGPSEGHVWPLGYFVAILTRSVSEVIVLLAY